MASKALIVRDVPIEDCPVLNGVARAQYREVTRAANTFGEAMMGFLERRSPGARAAWLRMSTLCARDVFEPWNFEILFLLSTLGPSRFGELHGHLGVSTRTLSAKLKRLTEAGFVERTVHDETPVRIEYTLTIHGARTAALAAPLFTHLNLAALAAAGRT